MKSSPRFRSLFEHDLFGKPLHTFRIMLVRETAALLEPFASVHFDTHCEGTKIAFPHHPGTVRVIRVSGDYRVRSTLFHASGGIAAQIRKSDVKSGTCGGAGAEGRRSEIAGGITEAVLRGQEPDGAGRRVRVARGRQA